MKDHKRIFVNSWDDSIFEKSLLEVYYFFGELLMQCDEVGYKEPKIEVETGDNQPEFILYAWRPLTEQEIEKREEERELSRKRKKMNEDRLKQEAIEQARHVVQKYKLDPSELID